MVLMRVVLSLLLFAVAAPAAALSPPEDYTGSDGGYVVYSVGSIKIGLHFNFAYHRVSLLDGTAANDWKSKIEPSVGGAFVMKVKHPDFTGDESGHVIARRLPPGQYVVDGFFFSGWSPGMSYEWRSKVPFSLPFTIRANQATYIGSFMRAPSGVSRDPQLRGASYFVIANRSGRDLPIARAKFPNLPPIEVQVTDVDQFGSAVLRSRAPDL